MSSGEEEENSGSNSDGFETMYVRVSEQAAIGAVESTLRDVDTAFDTLEQDLTREQGGVSEGDSGEEGDFFAPLDRKKKGRDKNRNGGDGSGGEEEGERDQGDLVEFFDFRRGPKHWPRGVELLSEDRARELIDLAMEEANKKQEKEKKKGAAAVGFKHDRAGAGFDLGGGEEDDMFGSYKKKDGEDGKLGGGGGKEDGEDGGGKLEGGAGMVGPMMMPGFYNAPSSEDELLVADPDDDLLDPEAVLLAKQNLAPVDAKFEYLRDRSTALVIPPGWRLKLDISGLTHEGLEKKAKAERERFRQALMSESARARAEKRALDKKKRASMYSFYDTDVSGAWDKDFWGVGMKNYVNEFTITFDLKLQQEPVPREGLALFQTSLVYVEENPTSGKKTTKQSDGECVVGPNGGVGIFGQFGDVVRAKLDAEKWRRVVISVRNVSEGKGEMRTWIDSVPCAVVKRDAFIMDGRFALDAEFLYLFSSQKQGMMPGGVLLRTVRVQYGASTDESVKLQHARDKLISMHEEERESKAAEERRGLALAKLFPKPRPLWTAVSIVGAIGDPFIEMTAYEGRYLLSWSYKVLHFALRNCVGDLDNKFLHGLAHADRQILSDVLLVLHQSSPAMNQMLRLLMHPNDAQVMAFLSKLRKSLNAMQVGDSLLLPVMIEHFELLLLVERSSEQMFRFVVVETDAERGLAHHPVNPSLGPKLRYRTCLVLSNIPKKNALDNVFWMALYSLATHNREGDLLRFYDVLLPFLTGKPLETSLWEAEEQAMKQEGEGDVDLGVIGDWNSPQRSSTSYVRTLLHALRYMMTSRGMGKAQCKQVVFALRAQLVKMMDNDLQFVLPDDNGQRVCRMACAQLSYSACKLVNTYFSGQETGGILLEQVKTLTDSLYDKLSACQDVEVELPPQLDLRDCIVQQSSKEVQQQQQQKEDGDEEELLPEDKSGEALELVIKRGPSASFKITAHSTTTVAHLLLRIERDLNVLVHEQRLIYLGRMLHTNPKQTLAECGLKTGAAIQLAESAVSAPGATTATGKGKAAEEETAEQRMRRIRAALRTNDPEAPAMPTQFMDALAWDAEQQPPNPGAAVSLRKYVPIDVLQMPSRVETRADAVAAIRLCDRLCTLLDNQPHCIKNDRFLISSLITHTFTQLVPIPKPRDIATGEEEDGVAGRLERRRQRKLAAKHKTSLAQGQAAASSATTMVQTSEDQTRLPDFARGAAFEKEMLKEACIWDAKITYELQVELLLVLQRVTEHFVASVFSIQQDRPFDGVVIVTLGCITALADAIMRRRASDLPSEVCSHLMGQTRDGRQLGTPGYGISPSTFASQTETIEIHSPEICIARTRVLDYFNSPAQRRLEKIFNWERHHELRPDRELIKYLRAVQREIANSDPTPHLLLVDGTPVETSLVKRNYPELRAYRDICFYWKCLMNPDIKSFPNWVDTKRDTGSGTLARFGRLAAQLHWGFEQNQTSAGYVVWCQFQGISLRCRPEPDRDAKGETYSKDRQPPTHRFPSTATPSFYVTDFPPIRTEDDVIYRPNLPGFEDEPDSRRKLRVVTRAMRGGARGGARGRIPEQKKPSSASAPPPRQQVLGQHDSELLISYLTVPYLRLPLVLTFFATDDRLHKLTSHKLRGILDSVLFEPGRYLALDLVGVAPTMVPTPHTGLLATPFGLLLNELARSPDTVLSALDALLEGALALDTGSVCDLGEDDFNVSVDIILYIARLGARCESFVTLLLSLREHECLSAQSTYRDLEITPDCLAKLARGRAMLRKRLLGDFDDLFEDYLRRLDSETKRDPSNERLIDRNSRLAADLHAIKILFHRNTKPEEYDESTARALIGSFVFLTTRHTWNKAVRSAGRILVPETELYEVLQVQRRRLVYYCRFLQQGPLDSIMQAALQISTSTTGSLRASAEVVDQYNRWARIAGERSVGRFAVGSTRTVAEENGSGVVAAEAVPGRAQLVRQRSYMQEVGQVPDSGALGVELDLQIGQMTLRSKHLSALPGDVANHPDVRAVFGTATMQASLVERASNRTVYRLVGLNHDIEHWHVPFAECPAVPEAFEREYNPSELFDSESWIPPLFEPVRKSMFDGPQPPPMQFLMLEQALPETAELAVLVGVHPILGGAFKLVYLFRKLRVVHVYQAVSHARVFWWTLHLTTDVRFCLRELQPSYANRDAPPPAWWKHGSGDPYPPNGNLSKSLFDDIVNDGGRNHLAELSVLIVRDAQHVDNLSNGRETLIPARFLLGLIPQCLLEQYRFWRDESAPTSRGRLGYVRLLGYALAQQEEEFMIQVEIQAQTGVEICGNLPSRTVRVVRRLRRDVEEECETKRRLAELLEQHVHLLVRSTKTLRLQRRKQRSAAKAAATQRAAAATAEQANGDDGQLADEEEAGMESSSEEDDAQQQQPGEEEGDAHGQRRARRRRREKDADSDEEDRTLLRGDAQDLFVGAVLEHQLRTNVWVECVVTHVYESDASMVDIELRGDLHAGVALIQVSLRDLRKRRTADSGIKSDDEEGDVSSAKKRSSHPPSSQQQQGQLKHAATPAQRVQRLAKSMGLGARRRVLGRDRDQTPTEGEGIWHWEGLSDSDDADWAEYSSDDEDEHANRLDEDQQRAKKSSLSFAQIDQLLLLLEAVGGKEEVCVDAIKRAPAPSLPFTSVPRLARYLARFCNASASINLTSHLAFSSAPHNDLVLLNCLYAPKASRLFSLAKTLARVENWSHICAWTRAGNLASVLHGDTPQTGVPPIDLVELPRLKLSFTCRKDHDGVPRLYSLDHADLFVANERNELTSKMLEGVPHSLLLCNTQGETSVLVPVLSLRRPIIHSQPFSTWLVLDRNDLAWQNALSQRYFLYPVHVSLSFLMSKGIDSGLYLMLLRFFHRDYVQVFRLADSVATDTSFSPAGEQIFHALALANDDFHPDAHACRLKISLVTMDSGVRLPWDLTRQMCRYVTKLSHVSAACRISLEEELQLLESEGAIAYETTSPAYRKHLHSPFVRAVVRNRQQALAAAVVGHHKQQRAGPVACYAPSRVPLTNWPYYVDNTVFGVVYEEMAEVKTSEEWEEMLQQE